jgi:pilus assembly protein Flp/PilA
VEFEQSSETAVVTIESFVKDESGATSIEYGLLAGFIALVIIGAVQVTAVNVSGVFVKAASGLK